MTRTRNGAWESIERQTSSTPQACSRVEVKTSNIIHAARRACREEVVLGQLSGYRESGDAVAQMVKILRPHLESQDLFYDRCEVRE